MSVAAVNSSNIPVIAKGSSGEDSLDQTDFLRLMTTQLQFQDPLSPTDSKEMVTQMAQLSSVSGISEMNQSLKDIADMISMQTSLLEEIRAASAAPANTTGTEAGTTA